MGISILGLLLHPGTPTCAAIRPRLRAELEVRLEATPDLVLDSKPADADQVGQALVSARGPAGSVNKQGTPFK